jgi:hypothetical protein
MPQAVGSFTASTHTLICPIVAPALYLPVMLRLACPTTSLMMRSSIPALSAFEMKNLRQLWKVATALRRPGSSGPSEHQ